MRNYLLTAFLVLVSSIAWSQNTNTVPPSCALATLGTCVPAIQGTVVRLSDAASAADCTAGGGDGSTPAVCVYTGSAWQVSADSGSGVWTGANGETIDNATNNVFDFSANTAGGVIISATDTDDTATLTVRPGGASTLTLGNTSTLSTALDTDGIRLGLGTESGNVGSFKNQASGNVSIDFRDYADTADDDMAHVSLAANCSTATSGAEECGLTISSTTGGAALSGAMVINPAGSTSFAGNTMGWSVVAGANTACTTTCTSACVFGVNTAATEADIVDCADATADECLCAGSN